MFFKEVIGMLTTNHHQGFRKISIRYTSDHHGKTLSLADDNVGLMIAVPYESVERLVRDA